MSILKSSFEAGGSVTFITNVGNNDFGKETIRWVHATAAFLLPEGELSRQFSIKQRI